MMNFNNGENNNMMMPPNPEMFVPPDMSWMNMARPPFMNNRFPNFAFNNNDDMDQPRPFMNPNFDNNMYMPPFPGMPPPQEMFNFNHHPFRAGFNNNNNNRGRGNSGRGRGGFHQHQQQQPMRQSQDDHHHHLTGPRTNDNNRSPSHSDNRRSDSSRRSDKRREDDRRRESRS